MKKYLYTLAALLLITISAKAQKLTVVDSDGNGIHLVTVLTEDGNMIGVTDLDGTLLDVKGAKKVVLTHVAFKSKLVDMSALQAGKVTMEDLDYSLAEIVVKPKPLIYVETYYRVYAFANDYLRYYCAGIMPNAYDPKNKKSEHGSLFQASADYAPTMGFAVNWGARIDGQKPGHVRFNGFPTDARLKEKYLVKTTAQGDGKVYSNGDGIVGRLVNRGSQARMTIDGGKMQMYANRVKGQTKVLKRREEKEYEYKFTLIHNNSEDGYQV